MKWLRRFLLLVVVGVVALAGVYLSLKWPYRAFHGQTFLRLERGVGTAGMARALQEAGVIRYQWQFLLLRAMDPSVTLVAGEYAFTNPASARDVFSRIAHGDVYFFEFNVPEGSNIFDIARLAEAAGVAPAQEFLTAAENPAMIKDLDPAARTLEGYLFPATYRLSHSTSAVELCQMMTAQFRRRWNTLAPDTDPHRTVTLASLVEKETGVADERPLIAGVFANRLRLGMALDCDPTTIYAALLDARYQGTIHRSDLASHNPYNTYQNPGLPPGPIANPGAAAIAAALQPAETDYLYFVAKPGGGGHQFSSNLAAHDEAVRAYRHAKGKGR